MDDRKIMQGMIPGYRQLLKEGNVLVCTDDTYDIGLVYLYCPFEKFSKIATRFYGDEYVPKTAAGAYCLFGVCSMGKMAGMTWVNDSAEKIETIPVMMHELSHLADNVFSHVGIKDESGEAKAYWIEREVKRLVRRFYRLKGKDKLSKFTPNDLIESLAPGSVA